MENTTIMPCPKCGREIKIPQGAAGEIGECPYCGHEFTISCAPDEDPAQRFASEVLSTRGVPGINKYWRLFVLSPWSVKAACAWIGLGTCLNFIAIIDNHAILGRYQGMTNVLIMIQVLAATLKGQRWARWVMIALQILCIGLVVAAPIAAAFMPGELEQNFWLNVFATGILSFAAYIPPTVLMFLPSSNNWFAISEFPRAASGHNAGSLIANFMVDDSVNFAWRRWSARMIDLNVAGVVSLAAWCLVWKVLISLGASPKFLLFLAAPEGEVFGIMLQVLLALLLEGAAYSFAQTLPGKALCGIAICDDSGKRASGAVYLYRNIRIFIRGMWLGLPLLFLIAEARQYVKVKNGRPASYDFGHEHFAHATRPMRKEDKWLPYIALFVFGVCHAACKWLPHIISEL